MPPPLAETIVSPVLIGREPERDALHYLIAQTRDATGRTMLIAGEAGIGKSRLVGEAVTTARAHGFHVLQGHCFETDRTLPYGPLLDLLRSDFANRSRADLRHALGGAVAELAPLLPEIALVEQGKAISSELEPEAAKRRVFHVLRDVILLRGRTDRRESGDSPAGGTSGPLLVAIEDLHWCDDLSLEFLLYFAPGQDFKGRDGFMQFVTGFERAFPDLTIRVLNQVANDDYVVSECSWNGTHSGPLATTAGDIPPTNKKVSDGLFCEVYQVRNGKIARLVNYQDFASRLRQLGLVP